MTHVHWNEYHRAWSNVTLPLRPNHEVVAAVRKEIAAIEGPGLLLGVTAEFAGLCAPLVAIDRNPSFVQRVWHDNGTGRCAVVGNWLHPIFADRTFALCLGDGSLSGMIFPTEMHQLGAELARVLRPGSRLVFRLFASPDTAESVADVKEAALAAKIRNFHAFKWRFAMALAAQEREPNIRLDRIYERFDQLFPDRDELIRRTGWVREQIETIEHYKRSSVVYSFPTRDQLLSVIGREFCAIRFVPSGTYELASAARFSSWTGSRRNAR